jgi:prepilin-type N-terminal cleavage/methylation domain-containing protein
MNKKSLPAKAFSLIELSIAVLIIGIIIAGITQSSSLIQKMALSSARSLTSSSPVASMRDLVA